MQLTPGRVVMPAIVPIRPNGPVPGFTTVPRGPIGIRSVFMVGCDRGMTITLSMDTVVAGTQKKERAESENQHRDEGPS